MIWFPYRRVKYVLINHLLYFHIKVIDYIITGGMMNLSVSKQMAGRVQ